MFNTGTVKGICFLVQYVGRPINLVSMREH